MQRAHQDSALKDRRAQRISIRALARVFTAVSWSLGRVNHTPPTKGLILKMELYDCYICPRAVVMSSLVSRYATIFVKNAVSHKSRSEKAF